MLFAYALHEDANIKRGLFSQLVALTEHKHSSTGSGEEAGKSSKTPVSAQSSSRSRSLMEK